MRKKIQLLLTIVYFCCFNILRSQTDSPSFEIPKLSPPTPEAFSLFKFTDIPVSHTTGIPNTSIPIHTIKLKGFEFPISLNYHSSGIRIEEIASNVGLGWTLNSGGMIYNQVNDLDDYEAGVGFTGVANSIPQNRELDPTITGSVERYNPTNPDYYTALQLTEAEVDTQPDIYYYNCGNLSGKFFYSKDGVANPMPYAPIKIIRNGYFSFVITDEKGTKYTFERISETTTGTTTIERPAYKMIDDETKSYTFHIVKIETINNEIINFTYEDEKYTYEEPSVFSSRESTYRPSGLLGDLIPGGLPLFVETETKNSIILRGKRLIAISTNTGENIQFVYNNCPRLDLPKATAPTNEVLPGGFALKEIKINSGQRNDSYVLEHGYFNLENYTPCTEIPYTESYYRLKLVSLKKNSDPAYEFKYNENGVLPGRFESRYDHWGYFRSTGARYSVDYELNFFDGVNRYPELEMTKLGVLNKIVYPTSGYTTFDYELNEYSGVFKTYAKRVERHAEKHIVGGEEIGLPNEPQYLTEPFTIGENYIPYSAFIVMEISTGEQTTSNFVNIYITDANNQSNNIIYHIVTESSTNNRRVYKMANLLPGEYVLHVDGSYSGGGASIYWQVKEGEDTVEFKKINVGGLRVKSISHFDNISSKVASSKQFYDYSSIGNPLESSGVVVAEPRYSYVETRSNPICVSAANSYYLDTGNMTYRCRNSKNYLPLSGLQGYHIMYSDVKVYNEASFENGYTHYKYSVTADDNSYSTLRNTPATSHDFKRGDLLEQNTYKFKNGSYLPVKKMSNEYYYGFSENGSFFSNATYPNEKHSLGLNINKLSGDVLCNGSGSWGIPIPPYRSQFEMSYFKLYSVWKYLKKSTELTYDKNGVNPVSTITDYSYNNPVHAQLSSIKTTNSKGEMYETKHFYPQDSEMAGKPYIADFVSGNRIQEPLATQTYNGATKLSEKLTVYDKSASTSNLLLPKVGYAAMFPNEFPNITGVGNLEKKITYDQYDQKGNILQYTIEGGLPVAIIWGYHKTQPIAKVENASYDQIASYVSNLQNLSDVDDDNCMSADCNEQILRNNLKTLRDSFPQFMVTTYTYNPLVGVTSVTDPKGVSSYYEYDTTGRLKFIKDQDLHILQKYCYNYKGQQTDCSDNTSTSDYLYKSAARSGTFTKKTCSGGGTGQSVIYNQAAGAYISTISQADADSNGLTKFNTDGQAYADNAASVKCIFKNTAKSAWFTRSNCAAGGTPESILYTVPAGKHSSESSQADADNEAQKDINANGLAYANANAKCRFWNTAQSGSFTRNNCAAGGVPETVVYTVPAGSYESFDSQAAADDLARRKVSADGMAYANANGKCTFYSAAINRSIVKNDCAAGGTGSSVPYSQVYGAERSFSSQAEADSRGLTKFNTEGQVYANANGYCTFYSAAISRSIAKNDCAVGGEGSSVPYSQIYGAEHSFSSQAEADSKGLAKFNAEGQVYANANGKCTFYSIAYSDTFTNDECGLTGTGTSHFFTLAARAEKSEVSQGEANYKAVLRFLAEGQIYANTEGSCVFNSAPLGGYFLKNSCPAGTVSTSGPIYFEQSRGAVTSTISQANADELAAIKFNTDGPNHANAVGECFYYSAPVSGSFTKTNCPPGGIGSTNVYSLGYGAGKSKVSQALADAEALEQLNYYGKVQAEHGGTCTYLSQRVVYKIYKDDYCPPGTTFPYVYYIVEQGKYNSEISQVDADNKAWADVSANAQAYANANGICLRHGEVEE